MSSKGQPSVTDYFRISRKRPVDQHPAKKRRIEQDFNDDGENRDEAVAESVVTSVISDHQIPSPSLLSTPSNAKQVENLESKRNHKRDSYGMDRTGGNQTPESKADTEKAACFTVGASAKKRLDMGAASTATDKTHQSGRTRKVARFTRLGYLSPTKKAGETTEETPVEKKVVTFEKKGALSPVKKGTHNQPTALPEKSAHSAVEEVTRSSETVRNKSVRNLNATLNKLDPQEIKAKLGKANNLADLKARLRQVHKFKVPEHVRRSADVPKLSADPISISISVPVTSPKKALPGSPAKAQASHQLSLPPASPQKKLSKSIGALRSLSSKSDELPLPYRYKLLLDVFRTLDGIIGMKYNRQEIARVEDVKKGVQNATKKDFKDGYLRQIRCVFPTAFAYTWEPAIGRYGKQRKDEFELHVTPNMSYSEDMANGKSKPTAEEQAAPFIKLGAKEQTERRQIFKGLLTSMVRDSHAAFLKTRGLEVAESDVSRWHDDFDVESCPDVDCEDLPAKPYVQKLTSAADVISATQELFGVNKRLEKAMADYKANEEKVKGEGGSVASAQPQPVVKEGLRGLPPALLEKVLAREKAKQIRAMTESSEDKKERNTLDELQKIGPLILNCHRSERQRQNRAALELKAFCKFLANSYADGRKGANEMEEALRTLVKLVPGFLQFRILRNVEYVKAVTSSPDVNSLRDRLEKLIEEKKV